MPESAGGNLEAGTGALTKGGRMTEAEWLECSTPNPMLEHLRPWRRCRRKLRLYACAACRLPHPWRWMTEPLHELLDLAERHCDGLASDKAFAAGKRTITRMARRVWAESEEDLLGEIGQGLLAMLRLQPLPGWEGMEPPEPWFAAPPKVIREWQRRRVVSIQSQTDLLRCIFGNPFRPAHIDGAWLAWEGGTIPTLALAAHRERCLPEGTLDPTRLAVLADALEEAGCASSTVLGHLRGPEPHVRGCWVVDLILGKE